MDSEGTIYVITESGQEVDVHQESWRNIRYRYNEEEKKIEEEELGTFTQYPVRLAWAITVHKSQGLTFSRVIIDFTGGVFAGGQAYVALSRCTSLEGICLKREITRGDIFVRPEIVSFAQRFNNQAVIERALKQAQADELYAASVKAFNLGDFTSFLDRFFKAIHSRYDIEKPLIQRFIRRKLNLINTLKEENRRLKEAMNAQKKNLEKYAHEYYLMGNECITKAHDVRAALANYDKPLNSIPNIPMPGYARESPSSMMTGSVKPKNASTRLLPCAPQNSSRSTTAASFACTPVTPKEPCAILTRQLLSNPAMPEHTNVSLMP